MSLRDHLGPLREADFRNFFCGEIVNNAGSSMSGVALAFAVLQIGSASALGIVVAAWTVPMVAFMLLGGVISDRLPRALVLRGCNLVEGIAQALVALLVLTGSAHVWELAVLQFVSGTVNAVSYPAFLGMVPVLLPAEQRKSAYLLIGQSRSALQIVGPALSGVLVAVIGPGWALAWDAATYFGAAFFLSLVRLPMGARPEERTSVVQEFVAGWSFARSLGWVIPIASCFMVFNALSSGAGGVLGPAIAQHTIGSDGWGFARAGQAIGVFVSALLLTRIVIRRPLRTATLTYMLTALPLLVLGTSVHTLTLAAAFFLAGCASSVVDLSWNLTVQELVPEQMLSRVLAIDGFFSFVAMPIGELLAGPAEQVFGARDVELGSVALFVVVGLLTALRPVISRVTITSGTSGRSDPDTVEA